MQYKSVNWCEGGYWTDKELNTRTTTEVFEQEYSSFSGLYDSEGRELHKYKNKIGFI